MMRFITLVTLVMLSVAVQAQNFQVSDIRLEGLQRVSAGTAFSALPIRVGDVVNTEDIQVATRSLFRVGLFSDVSIGRDGNVLVVTVEERPAINEIIFEGNKVLKTEDLMDSLRENDLSEGQIFQRATLEGISQALEREYIGQGRYGASVDIEVEDLPRNQVKVTVKVNEGEPARIKQINFVGNEVFDDDTLRDLFELSTTGWLSWFRGDDKYSQEKLSGDIETLESYYLDRGYLSFNINSTQVALSPDKSEIYITLNIDEGEVYTVDEVALAGDLKLPESLVRRMIIVRKGQTYSQALVTASSDFITSRLANEGYTFAEVEGIPEKDDEDNTVKLTFFVEPGQRAYVRRIEFKGNTRTLDEVLRREMRQMEGGAASDNQIEHSKLRLNRLGFFSEVEVETKEVPGTTNQVDVEYTVEEQPSGSLGLQVGFADLSGLLLSANVQQNNWFGTGKQVGISVNTSDFQTSYNINFNDPYYTKDGVSRGFNLFFSESDFARINISGFSTDTFGGSVNFGYPISEISRLGFSLEGRDLTVKPSSASAQEIVRTPIIRSGAVFIRQSDMDAVNEAISEGRDLPQGIETQPVTEAVRSDPGFLDENGTDFQDFIASISWRESTLNRGIFATRGRSQSLSLEAALPGGDLEYFKVQYNAQMFKPLTRALTLKLRTDLGFADSYTGGDMPFFEHFFGGGFGSVRGFERNSLGPRSTTRRVPFTRPFAFDDANGDGIAQNSELRQAHVVCEDPSEVDLNQFTCEPGELITQRGVALDRLDQIDSRRDAFGGNIKIELGAEVIFPIPFIENQNSMQSSLFIEGGNVFSTNCEEGQRNCFTPAFDKMSVSAGLGLTWLSGFGPLTFAIATPLNKNDTDRTQFFEFSLGGQF